MTTLPKGTSGAVRKRSAAGRAQTPPKGVISAHTGERLAIVYRPVSDLQPNPENAKSHPKSQIQKLGRLMKAYGCTNPILIAENNVMIAGHARLEVGNLIGMAEMPTIQLLGLSDEEKIALSLADRQRGSKTVWHDSPFEAVEYATLE